jgi:hypothetical protein
MQDLNTKAIQSRGLLSPKMPRKPSEPLRAAPGIAYVQNLSLKANLAGRRKKMGSHMFPAGIAQNQDSLNGACSRHFG